MMKILVQCCNHPFHSFSYQGSTLPALPARLSSNSERNQHRLHLLLTDGRESSRTYNMGNYDPVQDLVLMELSISISFLVLIGLYMA